MIQISEDFAFHPMMAPMVSLWESGNLAIINGVGYPDQDLSHFRSTDIWRGGSMETLISTGWLGRYLQDLFPEYPQELPSDPTAIEVKRSNTLLMRGSNGNMGMSLEDPELLYVLTRDTGDSPESDIPDTNAGNELRFVRELDIESNIYASKIYEASEKVQNTASYPNTSLGRNMALIARLIAGGLATRVYSTSQGGYDTHSDQPENHSNLLNNFAKSVAAFMEDVEALGIAHKVVFVTLSEFGRRIKDNGSGTDHGAASNLFLAGKAIQGGFYGEYPALGRPDAYGNLRYNVDFRQIYSSVLEGWMGTSHDFVTRIFNDDWELMPFINTSVGIKESASRFIQLQAPSPNPFSSSTTVQFSLQQSNFVTLRMFDMQGRLVHTAINQLLEKGNHTHRLTTNGLSSGEYVLVLQAGDRLAVQKAIVLK
jgi:uncharacterized protein (DUF1501 family)